MMHWILWLLAALTSTILLALAGWGLHRFCIYLEDCGYLYYRKKSEGGGGARVFGELDRLTRPSIQHVIEAKEERTDRDNDRIDGE